MGKAILFVRVSTSQQHLESQEDILRKTAYSDGYTDENIIVIGKKESAIKLDEENRRGIQELKEHVFKDTIDTVYIFELSRLSRRADILYSLREFFKENKVQLKCLNPPFTLLNQDRTGFDSTSNFVFSLFGTLAEQEMIEKKERFARGKKWKAVNGKFNGGNIPFGYKVAPELDNLIVIDEDDAAIVKEVFNLYEAGVSQANLAREFYRRGNRKLTMAFINNILNNERYTGSKRVYPGSSYERTYPVIISPQQFKRCRKIADENNTNLPKNNNIYYANKLIVCTQCGCFWSASGSKVEYRCYDAYNVFRKYEHYTTPQCTNRLTISINVVDSLLWYVAKNAEVEYIYNASEQEKRDYQQKVRDLELKLSVINSRLSEVDKRRERIVESYIEGYLSKEKRDIKFLAVDDERKEILIDQANFENEKHHLESLLSEIEGRCNLSDVSDIVGHLDNILMIQHKVNNIKDDALRNEIVHKHIKKVTIENSQLVYKFNSGEKNTKTRFITVELYTGKVLYYHYLPSSRPIIFLLSDAEGNAIERVDVEYLKRYQDEGKLARRKAKTLERKKYYDECFDPEANVIGYARLASFLKVSFSTAYKLVHVTGILKPAIVGLRGNKYVFNKKKSIEIMEETAKTNVHVRKLLKQYYK